MVYKYPNRNNYRKSSKKNDRIYFVPVLILLMLSLSVPALARTIVLPLKDILAVNNIRLQGSSSNTDRYEYKVSIPERWRVNQSTFTFSYSCSTALIKERSRLIFSFAGVPIHQIPLDPRSPKGEVTVQIPQYLLKPGYHAIRFEVAQHSVESGCEDPSAPELWTWVELSDAVITFDMALKPLPQKISAVSEVLFDPRNPLPEPINLIFSKVMDGTMKSVGLCASGVALRYDYRPVTFTSKDTIEQGMDTIMVGLDSDIRRQLAPFNVLEKGWGVAGPHLEMSALPLVSTPAMIEKRPAASTSGAIEKRPAVGEEERTDPKGGVKKSDLPAQDTTHSLILVTGRTWDEVETAATAFSLISLPLPDSPSVSIQDVQLPDPTQYTVKNILDPAKEYTLSGLGFNTHTFQGINPIPKGFGFRIPSDSHLSPNSQAILSLNIAYGAAMREDSVLNILLNDKFVGAVPCSDSEGGFYRHYEVRLLLSSMTPGYNKVTFSPQMTPLITDQCTMIQDGNLKMTLFDDSIFTLPSIDQWIEMPQLRALMSDGFPYGKFPDMRETCIVVPDRSKTSYLTAVNLVAMTSQKIGYPPLQAVWQTELPDALDKDLICVSLASALPDRIMERAPLKLESPGPLSYPQLIRPRGYDPDKGKGIWSKLIPSNESRVVDLSLVDFNLVVTRMDLILLDQRAAMLQFQSPAGKGRTTLLFTAHAADDMEMAGRSLWHPSFQAACKGDTALMNLSAEPVETMSLKIGPSYYLGKITPLPFVEHYTNTYPLRFIAGIVGLCIVLAMMAFWGLKRRSRRRMKDEE